MRTDVDALAYVKEHTFINEAGRSYQSGERMDEAIAILDQMVQSQRKELRTVDRDITEMNTSFMVSFITIVTGIAIIVYMVSSVDNPAIWVIPFSLVVITILSFKDYTLYTHYYKKAIQERRRLIKSISDNSLIQVNI